MDHLDRKIRIAAEKLRTVPTFETTALVTDDPVFAAQASSIFQRAGRYFTVLDGPRMSRDDASNELVRRRNALVKCAARKILIGGVSDEAQRAMIQADDRCIAVNDVDQVVSALRGQVKCPQKVLPWGRTNLGVGLYLARIGGMRLTCNLSQSPSTAIVERGRHLLVACEQGNALAEVTASNLAFSFNASFATFPQLPDEESEQWIEEIYSLGESASAGRDIAVIAARARAHISALDVTPFATVLWITGGFPWGIAVPATPSTHLNLYPDFGRIVTEGLWASRSPRTGSRTALLIDPGTVGGAEMPALNRALLSNGCLTQVVRDQGATVAEMQSLLDLIPYDIIVLSSHAGDAPGERLTFEYDDHEGRLRRLVVDEAMGFGYDRFEQKFLVTTYNRFHSLDGVDWQDKAAKELLPVGSAIRAWVDMSARDERRDCIVHREPVPRVNGSMGIKLNDGIWFFVSHGFPSESSPVFVNNSCWSWHSISERAMYAGARGYLGALRPILGIEAQQVSDGVFGRYIGLPLLISLWAAQRDAYDAPSRYPFVLVGLPCVAIPENNEHSVTFLEKAIVNGLGHWSMVANESRTPELRSAGKRNADFLSRKLSEFRRNLIHRPVPPDREPHAYK